MNEAVGRGALRVVPLGGLGEIGLNLLVLEVRDDRAGEVSAALAIDCGVMFPTLETPGIDLVIPDLGYLRALGDRLLGVLLTHGHEDHVGALPFLLRERACTVWGTAFTIALVRGKLAEHGVADRARLETFEPGARWTLGPFAIEALHVTHSIVDASGFAITTPLGVVVHTGDFKIDHTPIDGRVSDLARLAELGERGVLLLLSDSTNAERAGTTPSEREVGVALEAVFRAARGRVLAATFASHIHRVQQLLDLSARFDRKVALVGRALRENVEVARSLGRLEVPAGILVEPDQMRGLEPERSTVLTTGSQGEPRSALARIANDDFPGVTTGPGDVVVLSARVIPGNERAVTTIVNRLYRRGADVRWDGASRVHVSGHASQDELRLVLRLVRPRTFVPVHGEYRHLVRHAGLAVETGVAAERCFVIEDGQTVVLDADGARRGDAVETGRVFVDGKGVGDVEEVVLRDRRHLAEDGLILVILGVHSASGEVVAGPDLVSRGFVLEGANRELFEEARAAVLAALQELSPESRSEPQETQEAMRRTLKRFFARRLDRRPMILPFVMEM